MPQLTTLRLQGFIGDSLGEWLAGPFGSCAAFTDVTHVHLSADRCPKGRRLAHLLPALGTMRLDAGQPMPGLVTAVAQQCQRLQSLELVLHPRHYVLWALADRRSYLHTRDLLLSLPPRLKQLACARQSVSCKILPEVTSLSCLRGLGGAAVGPAVALARPQRPASWADRAASHPAHLGAAYGSRS